MNNRKTRPIIVALDGMGEEQALAIAQLLEGRVWGFKVNDLLVDCGVDIVKKLRHYGGVMADPKLYDIPNTVENSVKKLRGAGADLITVHASGGREMLAAAVRAANTEMMGRHEPAGILAVTVLTSFKEEAIAEVYGDTINAKVARFAQMAAETKCYGVVCSPLELAMLTELEKHGLPKLAKVVPGVRPTGTEQDDQQRTDTPRATLAAGASFIVMGRPIYTGGDPVGNVKRIMAEINAE